MQTVKTILLLDNVSKGVIKTNISTFSAKQVTFINSLQEITDTMLEQTNIVIILEGYLQTHNSLADLKLFKNLLNLYYIFLGADERNLKSMSEISLCYKTDISVLSYSIIEAACYSDRSLESDDAISVNEELNKIANKIINNELRSSTNEFNLAQAYMRLQKELQQKDKALDQLQFEKEQLDNAKLFLEKRNSNLMQGYSEIIQKAIKMNESLKQYEIIFTKNIYQKVNLSKYNNRPIIIYLKEHEHLNYLDKLVETIFNVFRIQLKKSAKVLRLYDNSGCRRILTLPKYYKVLSNRYFNVDIDANDFICKSGDYTRILETLLINRLHLEVLIIVDCKDHNDIIIDGHSILFNLCGRSSSFKALNLRKENTITNDNLVEDALVWNPLEEQDKPKDEEFLELSATPLIQYIIKSFRHYEDFI